MVIDPRKSEQAPPIRRSSSQKQPGQQSQPQPDSIPQTNGKSKSDARRSPNPAHVTPPQVAKPERDTTAALPSSPTPTPPSASSTSNNGTPKAKEKRPSILSRSSSTGRKEGEGRRSSWLNNLSSKFSSSSSTAQQVTPERSGPAQTPSPTTTASSKGQAQPNVASPPNAPSANTNGAVAPAVALPTHAEEAEEHAEPYIPSKPKESSFFSNLTRRLSSASQNSVSSSKVQGTGGLCRRRVLNVDPNRERCLVPELDTNKLRKVSFCVDVEIASGPRYLDEEEEGGDQQKQNKRKDAKMKERAEGDALKKPQAVAEEKEAEGEVKLDVKGSKAVNISPAKEAQVKENLDPSAQGEDADAGASPPTGSPSGEGEGGLTRKKEKKKKSEEERKERKEKRRRKAEESGSVPVELQLDPEQASVGPSDNLVNLDTQQQLTGGAASLNSAPPSGSSFNDKDGRPGPNQSTKQDRPTTDPVRIYRRCCQLRETPILKRITEQLMSPTCCVPSQPGVVNCLDLTTSRLQLADVITLGDWLAVVPVKNLRLEDADLNDEGVRCILAGLLAAKRPEPTRRKDIRPRHRDPGARRAQQQRSHEERSGVIERLTLKHNPRISRVGWKHICLFIYLCRSLKAIDLSLNQFPDTLPAAAQLTETKPKQNVPVGAGKDVEAAEILLKCLSERLGGGKLEELILSECGLSEQHVRKVVDGAVMCGISRLGLAGNSLGEEALMHVIRYLKSGVCQGLDLGGNNLHGKLGPIAEAMQEKHNVPCWGLSLAGCNLRGDDLQLLFPALVRLPDFRFIDLSHNRDLCTASDATISLFRRYMSQLASLKRIHLANVGMSPKQAIALADCLPDGPLLAHLNLLENPQLTALAHAEDEPSQEEACALYASLMAAVRVSSTLICIDIDVPSASNSEVVKALAKQVVAYSLRNMEHFAILEATGKDRNAAADKILPAATARLTEPHGGEKRVKEITVPDVLMHLVGHVDGSSAEDPNHDHPSPDDDYIVGGTGVVKALQYVLGEKANDLRRTSVSGTPASSNTNTPPPTKPSTPRESQRPGSSAGLPPTEEQRGKAKKMSKNLLDSARKIRHRLQPALAREAAGADELAYRRALFLDQTLQSMIQRFEEEYPETRLPGTGSAADGSMPPTPGISSSSTTFTGLPRSRQDLQLDASVSSAAELDMRGQASDEEEGEGPKAEELRSGGAGALKRHGSEVSLASRAQTLEEGRLHRMSQHLRREVVDSPTTRSPPPSRGGPIAASASGGGSSSFHDLTNPTGLSSTTKPTTTSSSSTAPVPAPLTDASPSSQDQDPEQARILAFGAHLEALSGVELKELIETEGWEAVLAKVGGNYDDLRRLQERDPQGWELFLESQMKARANVALDSGVALEG